MPRGAHAEWHPTYPAGASNRLTASVMEELLCKFAVFSLMALGSISWAQVPRSGNVFVGYSYSQGETFAGTFGSGSSNMNGWEGSAEGKFLPWIGIAGDFDWHYGGREFSGCTPSPCTAANFHVNASRHSLLFGPRASLSLAKYTPFAEFLMGIAHQTNSGGMVSDTDSSFATAVGGGLDYKLIKGVAWRVQLHSIHSHLFGKGQNDVRISTGIVFAF